MLYSFRLVGLTIFDSGHALRLPNNTRLSAYALFFLLLSLGPTSPASPWQYSMYDKLPYGYVIIAVCCVHIDKHYTQYY